MKLLLDCDHVFDRLTRGPFPTADADVDSCAADNAVQSHLQVCHECRQLAEALRPAVNLLHEAYDTVPNNLPIYLSPSPSPPLSPSPPRLPARLLPSSWHLVAASLLGVILGSLAAGGWFHRDGQSSPLAWSQPSSPSASGLTTLAALNLRDVCLPSSLALASSERLRCCTECHAAQGQGHAAQSQSGIDVARLQLACVACHER